MRGLKPCLAIAIGILLTLPGFGQVKKSVRSAKFKVPVVNAHKARIVCPIFEESQYPYQAVGFKLGDPVALTYKFYPSKHWAFAADGGKAASGLYNRYYRNLFSGYIPDTLGGQQTIKYLTHTAKMDWFAEAKFLYQWDAEKISKGLQMYAGAGWQWRSTTIQYDYLYEHDPRSVADSKFGKFKESRFTYGPVAVVGFEYAYFQLPLSAFIEMEWFTDMLLDPGYSRFQGGVGLRYVF